MPKKIIFKVSKDGTRIEVEGEGFQGKGCLETSEKFMRGLGRTTRQDAKPEMYQEELLLQINN